MTQTTTALSQVDGWRHAIIERLHRWRYALIALVAVAQAGVLLEMVRGRESLLANGRQIDLKVIPVDPRSLFRGDYVILAYDISRLPLGLFAAPPRRGETVYVKLQPDGGGWKAVATSQSPALLRERGDAVVLKGRVRYAASPGQEGGTANVTYGIESFFVPEGSGRAIEQDVGKGEVVAHIAVGADGSAAIRALTVDGRRLEVPPLL